MSVTLLLNLALAIHIAPPGAEPAREPQLAASGSSVGLAFGSGKAIYFASSTDAGATFAKPVKVAEADILPLNRHRGPRIAMFGNTVVITAVGGKKLAEGPHAHGLPSDGDLLAWRSTDGGKTWAQAVRVNDAPGAPTEGLHALTSDGKGRLFAAWLDKRGTKGTALFGAVSNDGGRTWTANSKIYESPEGTICECCHPSAAFAPDGSVQVMWRNWLKGSRDMYLARSNDGMRFSSGEKLGQGTWKLNACPMDGGGLVVAEGKVVSVWRRDGEIFLARAGEREQSMGPGVDVSVAAATNGVYLLWSTPGSIMFRGPDDARAQAIAPKGTFPNVSALPAGRILGAWEVDGGIEIRRLN